MVMFYLAHCALLLHLLITVCYAQTTPILLPVVVQGKTGYIDNTGKIAIEPKFDYGGVFSEGLAPFKTTIAGEEKFGYINQSGEIAIPARFDGVKGFSEGFAVVRLNGKDGFITRSGDFLIRPSFKWAWSFSDGMARFLEETASSVRYGFVDKTGRVTIPPTYLFARDFHEGYAAFAVSMGGSLKMGFINMEGDIVIKPVYSIADSFSEGLALVGRGGKSYLFEGEVYIHEKSGKPKLQYVSKAAKVIVSGNFEEASRFSEGLAAVQVKKRWVFINKTGRTVIATDFPEHAEIGDFSEGLAAVNMAEGAKFINTAGEIVLKTDFNFADDFSNGFARMSTIDPYGTPSYSYIDRCGKVIWSPLKAH